jgi:hypothetical protein
MRCFKAALVAIAVTFLAGAIADARPAFRIRGDASVIVIRGYGPARFVRPAAYPHYAPTRLVYLGPGFRRAARFGSPRFWRQQQRAAARAYLVRGFPYAPARYGPVFVQYGGGGYGPGGGMPPNVTQELGRQGYRDFGGVTRRGGNFVGEATGPRGGRERVIIDAESGRVRGSSPSGGGRGRAPGGFYGGY